MNIKKILFVILLHFFALNLFSQERRLSIIEFRSLTENDSVSKYVTNLLIHKLDEIDSLSQIFVTVRPQPITKENDYVTLKPLADSTECDYLITGDINIIDSIFALTIYIFNNKRNTFSSPINLITYDDSTSISEKLERVASIITGDMRHSDAINIISLENEEKNEKKGFLIFASDVRKAQIFMDNEYIGETPFAKKVKLGTYEIKMKNPDYEISNEFEYVMLSNTKSILYRSLMPSFLKIVGIPDSTLIRINKNQSMKFDTRPITIFSRIDAITLSKAGYYDKYLPLNVLPYKTKIINTNLEPKSKIQALLYSSIVPGSGQLYIDNNKNAYIFGLAALTGVVTSITLNNKVSASQTIYKKSLQRHKLSVFKEEITYTKKIVDDKKDQLDKDKLWRNIALTATISVWIGNIVNVWFWDEPESEISIEPTISVHPVNGLNTNIKMEYRF